jgi:hypothetical protein
MNGTKNNGRTTETDELLNAVAQELGTIPKDADEYVLTLRSAILKTLDAVNHVNNRLNHAISQKFSTDKGCGCHHPLGEVMGIGGHQFRLCPKHAAFRYLGFAENVGFSRDAFITAIVGMQPLTEQDAWCLVRALQSPHSGSLPGPLVKHPDDEPPF